MSPIIDQFLRIPPFLNFCSSNFFCSFLIRSLFKKFA